MSGMVIRGAVIATVVAVATVAASAMREGLIPTLRACFVKVSPLALNSDVRNMEKPH